MKKILLFLALVFSMVYCFGQTQAEMNKTEHDKYLKENKRLNNIYQTILKEYKEDTTFIKNFKASQKIWIQFRDAEIKMKYPDRKEVMDQLSQCAGLFI